ncbi:phage baseplate protein [Mammaliicoccus sciuri]
MPYLGDILIEVIQEESLDESSTTTDHALEDGEQISDHIENDPITLSITGVIIDPNDEKLLKLREYRQKGKVLDYSYRSRLKTVLITSFKPVKGKDIKDGYRFSMTLKQVQFSKAPNVIRVSVPVKKQVKKVTSKGKQTVKKAQKPATKKVTSKKAR